jgi:single-strand DNA-binding protein
MFCKNRITLIGFLGKDAETKDSGEYRTRTEWHRIVVWGKFGEWAGSLKRGAFLEIEGELRYREFQPKSSDAKIRTAEIHAISILTLDHAEKTEHEGESAAAGLTFIFNCLPPNSFTVLPPAGPRFPTPDIVPLADEVRPLSSRESGATDIDHAETVHPTECLG